MSAYTHPMTEYSTVTIARPTRAGASLVNYSGDSDRGGDAWD